MQIWAESRKSALPICNYSQILYQFLTFTQNLKRSLLVQPGCSGQVVRPVFPIPGQFFCRLLGKVQAFLRFVWHCVPPSDFRI